MTQNVQEAMFLLMTLEKAQKGDEESKKMIELENELRKELNQPTVEEELKALIKKGQAQAKQK